MPEVAQLRTGVNNTLEYLPPVFPALFLHHLGPQRIPSNARKQSIKMIRKCQMLCSLERKARLQTRPPVLTLLLPADRPALQVPIWKSRLVYIY